MILHDHSLFNDSHTHTHVPHITRVDSMQTSPCSVFVSISPLSDQKMPLALPSEQLGINNFTSLELKANGGRI